MITLVNGRQTDQISVHDRGLAYGDGVFETLLTIFGEIPLWNYHLARLERSLTQLDIKPFDSSLLPGILKKHTDSSCHQIIKITITRGVGPRGYAPPAHIKPTTIITIMDREPDLDGNINDGVKVSFCDTCYSRQAKLAGIKHLNRLEQILARSEIVQSGLDEGIMLDQMGNVISATMHNLFLVKDGAIITPDLTYSGVAGVMREFVIGLAHDANIPVNIKEVSKDELLSSNELFLTNSIHGIWPICELDSTIISVGEITSRLRTRVMEVIPYCD